MKKEDLKFIIKAIRSIIRRPRYYFHLFKSISYTIDSFNYVNNLELKKSSKSTLNKSTENKLKEYFDSNTVGKGIWKWEHYFDIYERYFSKFVGKEVNILEIGVYSGGSLDMWRSYFGDKCNVYGVDIEKDCKVYENDFTKIYIGDQEDRTFWKNLKKEIPNIDILIDDGGHTFNQQIVTLEEMLPHLSPGGVYLCEDIHGETNLFNSYINGISNSLNSLISNEYDKSSGIKAKATTLQKTVKSVGLYPFVVVIEKQDFDIDGFAAPKHGTEWQPFL